MPRAFLFIKFIKIIVLTENSKGDKIISNISFDQENEYVEMDGKFLVSS